MKRGLNEMVVLAAPIERVWEAIMDPTLLERWVTAHGSIDGVEPGPAAEGESFAQTLKLAGKSFEVEWTLLEADPPGFARWRGMGPAGSAANVSYRLTDEDGGTRFEYENRISLPGGPLGRVAGALLAAAPGSREARRSLERLRALVESDEHG